MYSFNEANHCHTFNGKPLIGTTTALSVLAKELTWWSSGMAVGTLGWLNSKTSKQEDRLLTAGQSLEKIKVMGNKEYLALLDTAYKAHNQRKKDSAVKGIDMHSLLEDYIKGKLIKDYKGNDIGFLMANEQIRPFIEWSEKNVKRFLFSELYCYSEKLWCGGIADFAYEDMDGEYVLGDFKSSKAAYWNHWVQVGGYMLQIEENGGFDQRGNKVFTLDKPFNYHAIFCEGAGLDKPFIRREIEKTKKAFECCVELYRMKLYFEEGK